MPVSFGGVSVKRQENVSLEQLQRAWEDAVKAMERSLAREAWIRRQEDWLQRNQDSPVYGEKMRQTLYNRDDWYVSYLQPFYDSIARYGRLLERAGPELEVPMLDVSPYTLLGPHGLHQMHGERARELFDFGVLETQLPF
jgi:hypothetical protein